MTGFFLLLAAIVLVLAIIAALLGRLSDEDGEISSINPIWLVFAAVLFVGFCYCAFLASKWGL